MEPFNVRAPSDRCRTRCCNQPLLLLLLLLLMYSADRPDRSETAALRGGTLEQRNWFTSQHHVNI